MGPSGRRRYCNRFQCSNLVCSMTVNAFGSCGVSWDGHTSGCAYKSRWSHRSRCLDVVSVSRTPIPGGT